MDGERFKVLKALGEFRAEVEKIIGATLTEEGGLLALKGASVWWYKRTVSVFNPNRRYRRGETRVPAAVTVEELIEMNKESLNIVKENGSVDPKSSPGKWTSIVVEMSGNIMCVPILTALLEVTLMRLLEFNGVNPLKYREGQNVVGRDMPRASRANGVVMGVIADYLVVEQSAPEMNGYKMKALSKRIGSRGTTIVAGAAGYSCAARVRRSSMMIGTMVIVSELKTNMARMNTWEGKRKRNTELYEEKFGGKSSKNKPRREEFPRPQDKIPNMEDLKTINQRLRQAKASTRKFGNKLSKRLRTRAQKKILATAIKNGSSSDLGLLIKSFKAVPPMSTKSVTVPLSFAEDVPPGTKTSKELFKWVCENFSRAKFLSKSTAGAKMAATIYFKGFTSTRDVPTEFSEKMCTGLEKGAGIEMLDAVCHTGDKAYKASLKVVPLVWVENPIEEREDGGEDMCMVGTETSSDDRKRIVLSLEASAPVGKKEEISFKDEIQKEIEDGKISQPSFIRVENGDKTILGGGPGLNFCTGLSQNGSGDPNKRAPFLIYKSAEDAAKGKAKPEGEKKMEVAAPSTKK